MKMPIPTLFMSTQIVKSQTNKERKLAKHIILVL